MKFEELLQHEKQSQVGVTLQRKQFETEIDIFPQLSPLIESLEGPNTDMMMSEVASLKTEEEVIRSVKHQTEKGDEEFQAIPGKVIVARPSQHRLQSCSNRFEATESSQGQVHSHGSNHAALIDEIDRVESECKVNPRLEPTKKESTLSRMLRGFRGEKEVSNDVSDRSSMSLTKILNKINPVGKASRGSISKAMNRIGDAIQKKGGEDEGPLPEKSKGECESSTSSGSKGSATKEKNYPKIGEKMFRYRATDSSV